MYKAVSIQAKSRAKQKRLHSHFDNSRDALDIYLRELSDGMTVSEKQDEPSMEEYSHPDGTHPQKKTDISAPDGYIQMGYSRKSKELVMAFEKKTNSAQNAAYEHERRVDDKAPDRPGKPRLITLRSQKEAAAGLRHNNPDNKKVRDGLITKAVKTSTAARFVLPFLESRKEKGLKAQLLHSKNRLGVGQTDGDTTSSLQKTADDKKLNKLDAILSRKQQKKTQFDVTARKTEENIQKILEHTADDTLDLLLKKKNTSSEPAPETPEPPKQDEPKNNQKPIGNLAETL